MSIALITGSNGLIGSESTSYFCNMGFDIIGIDNDMRAYFFGHSASTRSVRRKLEDLKNYEHLDCDIRNYDELKKIFSKYASNIELVIHTAAQPSHDWAAKEPLTDFAINATGTLNLLELARIYSPSTVFIYTSTNKVYGDSPNYLPLIELESRFEIDPSHEYAKEGIPEEMSIDNSIHSLFGVSKLAADMLTQEYGKYFGMKTGVFRGGCLTGPAHLGAELHGFLSYLIKCGIKGDQYNILGYKGKQVRDNIHSHDLVNAFWHFFQNPKPGEVYNIGGSRYSNISVLEAIELFRKMTGKEITYSYKDTPRKGDHIWYISDVTKFKRHYPGWAYKYNIEKIFEVIIEAYNLPVIK